MGRLTEKRIGSHTVQTLCWNAESQLTEVATVRNGLTQRVRFSYDALGRRVSKTGSFGSVFFVWSGMRLLQELQGAKVTTHVYEDQDSYVPLARIESMDVGRLKDVGLDYDYEQNPQFFKPRVYYIHANSAGAPEELTDPQGHVVWQARYQTWGNVALQPDTGPDPHGFALPQFKPQGQCLRLQGQYADSETGLHYNTFRFYDPDVGRFISQDPIGLAGGLNLYQYAPNPLSWIDPWGWSCSTDAKKLARNLGGQPSKNYRPHHIVMSNSQDVRMRFLRRRMNRLGVGINNKENGIWLPKDSSSRIPGTTATAHGGEGIHGNAYKDHVWNTLKGAKTKIDFEQGLQKLKSDLFNGMKF